MKEREKIPRRDFLGCSLFSAGLLVPGVLRCGTAGARARRIGDTGRAGSGKVRIGYWDESERLESFEGLTHAAEGPLVDALNEPVPHADCTEPCCHRIVDAAAMREGDPRFAKRGARVTIHGLFLAGGARRDDLCAMSLFVHAGPSRRVPFLAWGCDSAIASNAGSPNVFRVAVEKTSGLSVSFDVAEPGRLAARDRSPLDADSCQDHLVTHFAIDDARGKPKLRRGVYLLSWSGSGSLPRWENYEMEVVRPVRAEDAMDEATGLFSRLARRRSRTSSSREFPYLLVSVDFAG